MSNLDEELDREVQRILTRGAEGRRDAEVKALTASSGSLVVRVAGVAVAIAALSLLLHAAGFSFAVHAARDLCRAIGLCG